MQKRSSASSTPGRIRRWTASGEKEPPAVRWFTARRRDATVIAMALALGPAGCSRDRSEPGTPNAPTRSAASSPKLPDAPDADMKAGAAKAPTPSAASSPKLPDAPDAPDADMKAGATKTPTFPVHTSLPGIDLLVSKNHGSHLHGGAPASISRARVNLNNTGGENHTVTAKSVAFKRGHCRSTTWDSRKELVVTGVEVHNWHDWAPVARHRDTVTIPGKPGLYQVSLLFDPISAYQACDRFAFDVELSIDGTTVATEVELSIKRYTPLRKSP